MSLFIALLGWACAWFAFGRPARLEPSTSTGLARDAQSSHSAPVAGPIDLSVVVPARNEAHTLPTLLGSLARSRRTPIEVIVVDDGSSDATAEVARAHGATVIVAPPPPVGWLGKSWACHLGAQRARGTRLLFLDADVTLAPTAIAALDSYHTALGGGLLSVQPSHLPQAPYEQLSALFNIVAPMGTGAFAVTRPRPLRAAFGPCLFTSAADYTSAGGHQAVRHEVVEDIVIAAHFTEANRPVAVLLGGDLVTFRMYAEGLNSLANGWTKNVAAGAIRAHPPSAIAAALWVASLNAVTLSALVAASAWWFGGSAVPWVAVAAWLASALQVHLLLRLVGRFHLLTALLFAIPLAFFVAIFVRSAVCLMLSRPVQWRGRSIVRGVRVSS